MSKNIKFIEGKCLFWPDCRCYELMLHYQWKLTEYDGPWEFEELQTANLMIFVMLSCVSHHCPDSRIRLYALRQLRDPFWDRQRAGKGLTEEETRRMQ